ncbi:MAG: hypothetical protein ACOX8Q_02060 [Christensenellales bacterium]|jgi:hypothetical protein
MNTQIQQRIAGMVKNMRFDRKKRITKKERALYAGLEEKVEKIIIDLNKLHLRLWHAVYKKDYHSLNLVDAKQMLRQISQSISNIIDEDLS